MDADAEQLAVAAAIVADLVAAIADDQWSLPTPCTDWTVRDLVAHVVAGNRLFVAAFAGVPAPAAAPASDEVAALARAYGDSVGPLVEAFARPGALEQTVTVPFGTVPGAVALHLRLTELLTHGWDLAQATGQVATFPDELAEQELAFSRRALGQIPADRRPFGPPVPVADEAPAIERLVACLGRSVPSQAPELGAEAAWEDSEAWDEP